MSKNKLVLVSGPSGTGKTSTMRKIMRNEVVSFTTREPRHGEINGVDYTYIDEQTFRELLQSNGLAEYATYSEASYGITAEELQAKLSKGDAFAIVNPDGKEQLERIWDNTVSIFVFTTPEEARKRMMRRGDSEANIEKRLKTFIGELDAMVYYDYQVHNANGDQALTVELIKRLLDKEGVRYDS